MEANQSTQNDSSSTASRFQNAPVDVLYMIFKTMTPKERVATLRTCKQWKDFVSGTQSFWREGFISDEETIESAISILSTFSTNSAQSLKSVVIECVVPEEKLDLVFEILKQSKRTLSFVHLTQDPSLNLKTRNFARTQLPVITVLSTVFDGNFLLHDWAESLTNWGDSDFKGTSLTGLYVNDLIEVTAEDLEWMKTVKGLQIDGTIDSVGSIDEVLSCVPNLEVFSLGDTFEVLDESDRILPTQMEFLSLRLVKFPISHPYVPPRNWRFPALLRIIANDETISVQSPQMLNNVEVLELLLTVEYSESGRETNIPDTFDVSDSLSCLPSLTWLRINLPGSGFSIVDLLSEINSCQNQSGAIPSLSLEKIELDYEVPLNREDVVQIIEFKQVRHQLLREAKMGKPKTKLEQQRETDGEEPYQFQFCFASQEQEIEFENRKLEIEMEIQMEVQEAG